SSSKMIRTSSEPGIETLREQWAQQIHEAAAQQERNRLARELHDSIKQQLFSINVSAATVQARRENDEAGARTALVAQPAPSADRNCRVDRSATPAVRIAAIPHRRARHRRNRRSAKQ